MILTEIALNTSELATWFIGAVITAMCFLLYNILQDLRQGHKDHEEELKKHGLTLVEHKGKIESLEEKVK